MGRRRSRYQEFGSVSLERKTIDYFHQHKQLGEPLYQTVHRLAATRDQKVIEENEQLKRTIQTIQKELIIATNKLDHIGHIDGIEKYV